MPAPVKIEQLNELKAILNEKQNFVLTTYSGLSVTQISDLRAEVREKNARLKVIKNNLFYRALKEIDGLAHVADDLPEARRKTDCGTPVKDAERIK